MTTDVATDILGLIDAQWTPGNMTNKFEPSFSVNWWTEAWNVERLVTIRELGATHIVEDASNAKQRIEVLLQLDLWALDRTDCLDMRSEVDRIVNAYNNNPVSTVSFIVQKQWVDNSFLEGKNLVRYTLQMLAVREVDA